MDAGVHGLGDGAAAALADYADHLERLQWSALLVDEQWRLVWVSSSLKAFVGASSDAELGVGRHIVEAVTSETWMRTVAPDSQVEMFGVLMPFVLGDLRARSIDPAEILPERFHPLLEGVEPTPAPPVNSMSFAYVRPDGDTELPSYRVDVCMLRLRDDAGADLGWLCLFFMGVRPNLLELLARGDERMYERMARLVDPGPRQAAVLFCDLHQSGRLSRQLPTASYFKLVRALWTGIDAAVADEHGVVGKHAGDGGSAFFLVEDLESPSGAARAAINAARRIHDRSRDVFSATVERDCHMKVGLHWGGSLYVGQLVPGGRLDVTALGDEVNEAARIQESAGAGETLASKQLLERLTPEDAAAVGLDLEKLTYRPLAELDTAPEKAVRDAAAVPVTVI
ncbi:MAG TPA: adenylate/guanylate cyclase domain-containing protein [Actinomycetota bacterium]|nr:adenylate/guanylate cyclase domain-containing protein [Actinomycetota bacterium]